MGKTHIVIGAGFRGFCDSMHLLNQPGNRVIIVDSAPFFGGISYSGTIKGFAVDKGVHLFDAITPDLVDILSEIMDGKIRHIDPIGLSAYNRVMTEGFSLPDLSSLDADTKDRITHELHAIANAGGAVDAPVSLAELFLGRFGTTAGGIFCDIFKAVYNTNAQDVQPDALSKTSLSRLKHLDDAAMLALKSSDPWLDSVLAARRAALGPANKLITVYPDDGHALRGWCDRAAAWLTAKGAQIFLGENITAITQEQGKVVVQTTKQRITGDSVIWTNDNTHDLAKAMGFEFDTRSYLSTTPMVFATFFTKASDIADFTYLQNFDPGSLTYRTATAGIYSGQVNSDGVSFITCECPTSTESPLWQEAERFAVPIWQECKDLGLIHPDAALVDHHILRLPATYKVAKLGYDARIHEFTDAVATRNPRVIFRDVKPFFRCDIYAESKKNIVALAA